MSWLFGNDPTIVDKINELPQSGVTVYSLKALDFVVPGQWQNYTNFDEMLRKVTGETDAAFLDRVKQRVVELYNTKEEGYQRATWIYDTVNSASGKLGAAAMADKLADSFSMLSFMKNITPKADTVQTLDFIMKTIGELIAFTKVNGIPGNSVGDFVKALGDYAGESKMRMAALVCYDGVLPLGPDFINKATQTIQGTTPDQLQGNSIFSQIGEYIPGGGAGEKLGFIGQAFGSVKGWMSSFVTSNNISPDRILQNVKQYVDVADNKLDYVSAFIDMYSDYYQHTGRQTVAVRMIERAVNEV